MTTVVVTYVQFIEATFSVTIQTFWEHLYLFAATALTFAGLRWQLIHTLQTRDTKQ